MKSFIDILVYTKESYIQNVDFTIRLFMSVYIICLYIHFDILITLSIGPSGLILNRLRNNIADLPSNAVINQTH